MSTVTCDGSCYLWWVLLPVIAPVTCDSSCYLWWVLLPVMGPVTCDGFCYLWWVLLPVRGPVTCEGPCYLWGALLPVMGPVTCDGFCYLWLVLLPVTGLVTCEGPCYLWWVLLPVMGPGRGRSWRRSNTRRLCPCSFPDRGSPTRSHSCRTCSWPGCLSSSWGDSLRRRQYWCLDLRDSRGLIPLSIRTTSPRDSHNSQPIY